MCNVYHSNKAKYICESKIKLKSINNFYLLFLNIRFGGYKLTLLQVDLHDTVKTCSWPHFKITHIRL